MDNTFFLWAALIMGLAALGLAVYFARVVLAASQGSPAMVEISSHIRAGAMAFIKREYTWVAVFVAAMFLLIGFMLDDGWLRALAYLAGALLSAGAGFVGMRIATAANARGMDPMDSNSGIMTHGLDRPPRSGLRSTATGNRGPPDPGVDHAGRDARTIYSGLARSSIFSVQSTRTCH